MKFASAGENIKKFFGLDFALDLENESSNHAEVAPPLQTTKQPIEKKVFQSQKEVSKPVPNKTTTKNNSERLLKKEKIVGNKVATITPPSIDPVRENNILSIENAANTVNTKTPRHTANKKTTTNVSNDLVKKVTIFEPRTYAEVQNIANAFFRNEIVIVKFNLVEESQARRIVDFLTGAVFALDGDIQRLDSEMFICTPSHLEVDSDTADSLLKSHLV
ncbi:cell division protein SepF [Vagococcus xieshaowenii]|uniref:Cell division protein SepF n=1 Tax=Vagococcus xieshaowenii TaxID=2562451 RepID=A0AAJ5JME0_9ENTE|nr:cell division protein SepF [Vagococcus xieshaowenii]QCA28984.1 cell division protein SepF [Vagococcus xieshaowenii]TFZ43165.1 cell division protein SepF [Vagococcus xieshaowenii]